MRRRVWPLVNSADFSGMNAAPSPAAEGRTVLYHRRHAQQQVAKSLGHLSPAVVLLLGVAPVLAGEEHLTLLLALEIALGAAYLVLMVREMLHLRHRPFHRESVAWLELAAAAFWHWRATTSGTATTRPKQRAARTGCTCCRGCTRAWPWCTWCWPSA